MRLTGQKITVTGITVTNCKTKTYAEKEEKDSKGTNPIIIVIAVIAGIAIAVVVIVIIMNKKSSEAFDEAPASSLTRKIFLTSLRTTRTRRNKKITLSAGGRAVRSPAFFVKIRRKIA